MRSSCGGARVDDPAVSKRVDSVIRLLSMKENKNFHSRICNLTFVCILLGTVAILCGITSMNSYEFFGDAESTTFFSYLLPDSEEEEDLVLGSHEDYSSPDFRMIKNSSEVSPMSLVKMTPVDLSTLSDVYHNMTEGELLWRASATVMSNPRPASVPPKVAFLFLGKGPMPLAPLWERYFKGHAGLYSIYLHTRPSYRPNFPPDSVFYRRNIPSKVVFWGRMSMMLAERRLLANALLDAANERFVLLSHACIPVTTFPVAYKYFTESEHSFVDVFKDPGNEGLGRYNRIENPNKLNPIVRAWQWRKGGQWFEMSRSLALIIISDTKYFPKFQTVMCKSGCVCYIDEHYLATVLTILVASKLANRTTTYVDFSTQQAHPREFEAKDITEALLKNITTDGNCTYNGNLTNTCRLFARKFSPGSIEPLLKLAATSFGIS